MKQATIERLERCQPGPPPNPGGLAQFEAFESRGIVPDAPDGYFERLCSGKAIWEVTVNLYAEDYNTRGVECVWPGWAQLEDGFKDDPAGLLQIRQRIGLRKGHNVD